MLRLMVECPNKYNCGIHIDCVFCGAPSFMINDDCEGCCGNVDCVPYARLENLL